MQEKVTQESCQMRETTHEMVHSHSALRYNIDSVRKSKGQPMMVTMKLYMIWVAVLHLCRKTKTQCSCVSFHNGALTCSIMRAVQMPRPYLDALSAGWPECSAEDFSEHIRQQTNDDKQPDAQPGRPAGQHLHKHVVHPLVVQEWPAGGARGRWGWIPAAYREHTDGSWQKKYGRTDQMTPPHSREKTT